MTDRSARLAALAARAGRSQPPIDDVGGGGGGGGGNDQAAPGDGDSSKRPTLSFRNYVPKDASLDDGTKISPGDGATAPPTLDDLDGEDDIKLQTGKRRRTKDEKRTKTSSALELALARTSRESREAAGQNVGGGGWGSVTPVATRKVNWDLKRDVQRKIDKLERRTQRAIVELLRERLEREAAEGGGGRGDDDDDGRQEGNDSDLD